MDNYLVFREEPLTEKQIGHREEHNERRAVRYNNTNIDTARSERNIYFKKPEEHYAAIFQKKKEAGEITTKGLKEDAAHYSEILVAVNRDYWTGKSEKEVREFFGSAYRHLAGKFGEENIISAAVHCDEVSEGRINYHMHVTAIPVVEKKRYYTKRSRQYKALAKETEETEISPCDERLLKCIEKQVSHSKFFESGRDENHRMVYSYSVWQDDLLDALRKDGFVDIQRGSSNQKAPHLHPMQYKQIMSVAEEKAELLLPDIVAEPLGGDYYRMKKQSVEAVCELKKQVAKEKAVYDLAVDELKTCQSRMWERQHQTYCLFQTQKELNSEYDNLLETASGYEKEVIQLKKHCDELREENDSLKKKVEEMFHKILEQNQWLKSLIQCLGNIYQEAVKEDGKYSLAYFKKCLKELIDNTLGSLTEQDRMSGNEEYIDR